MRNLKEQSLLAEMEKYSEHTEYYFHIGNANFQLQQ